MRYFIYPALLFTLLLGSCTTRVPDVFTSENKAANIYPDYNGVTIPCNIAPLNFCINDTAEDYVTRIRPASGEELVISGKKVEIGLSDWKEMLEKNKGKSFSVDIFEKKDGKWFKFKTATNFIAPEPIDEYLSYRIIEPGYSSYEGISINQRNLTNFQEKEIYNNFKVTSGDKDGQCINCHSYQNYHTANMQMHVRQFKGGTVIVNDGKAVKVNTKTDSTVSGGVYPAWHPSLKLIAYSVNTIGQSFHSKKTEKVEVIDSKSDLVLFDINKNEIRHIVRDKGSLETWPTWSPDGKTLYFASARYQQKLQDINDDIIANYQNFKYNLLSIPFDPATGRFGQQDTVFSASRIGKSASLPRISPDGRYLLFTMADYGNFHIWHKSSDLYLMDLQSKTVRNMTEINSPDVESYHSWSSNGRWIIFSTRRDDGSYTRPYIAYFDKTGKAGKPFILPQKDPGFYPQFFKSFNIPEFMVEPVKLSPQDFFNAIDKEGAPVKYVR